MTTVKSYTLTVKSKYLPGVSLPWLHIGKDKMKSKIFEIYNFITITGALLIKKKKYLKISASSHGNNRKRAFYTFWEISDLEIVQRISPPPLFRTFLSLAYDFKMNAPVVVEEMIQWLLVIHMTMEAGFGKLDLTCSNEVKQWLELEAQIYEKSWNYIHFLSPFSNPFSFPHRPPNFLCFLCLI